MKEQLIKSDGTWNYPVIDSELLNIHIKGYVPKIRGGCIAFLKSKGKYLLLGEDDDHYFDISLINKKDLIELEHILNNLSKDISVKIDHIESISKTTYKPNKRAVFSKNYSTKNFKTIIKDRIRHSPLIEIKHRDFILEYDVYWSNEKLKVIQTILK